LKLSAVGNSRQRIDQRETLQNLIRFHQLTSSLRDQLLELALAGLQLPHTQDIGRLPQQDDREGAEKEEPEGLVEARLDEEGERRSARAPEARIVGREDSKRVLPRGKVRVVGNTPFPRIDPVPIEPVETISERHALGSEE